MADVPVVVVTAKDLTREDRSRLNGAVAGVFGKDELGAQAMVDRLHALLGEQLTTTE